MSLESKIEALIEAVTNLTDRLDALQSVSAPPSAGKPAPSAGKSSSRKDNEPEQSDANDPDAERPLTWYHNPDTREVWQEPERGRRKGVTKVDPETAKRLKAKYAEEDAQGNQETQSERSRKGEDSDMDLYSDESDLDTLGGSEDEEAEPMDDDEFSAAWKDWTKRAIAKVMSDHDLDKEAAQAEVKKYIVPKVREMAREGVEKATLHDIPADNRRAFLAKAEKFFE